MCSKFKDKFSALIKTGVILVMAASGLPLIFLKRTPAAPPLEGAAPL